MPLDNNNFHEEVIELKPKQTKWKFALALIFIIAAVFSLYGFFVKYWSPSARENRQLQESYEKYLEWEKGFEKAMREDTYGGKTPEETLALFIDALKKEDIELASRYIYQGVGGSDYRNREKYREALMQVKQSGKLQEFINLLSKVEPNHFWDGGQYFSFTIRDIQDEDNLMPIITLFKHQYSTVWKIQSL